MAGLRAGLESGELHFRRDRPYCLNEKDLERWRTDTGMKRKKGEGTSLGDTPEEASLSPSERDQPMKARTPDGAGAVVEMGRLG